MTSDLSFATRVGLNRPGGGVLGLIYPVVLIGLALTVGFHGNSEPSELATATLAAILFLVAAPTTWVFAIDFIEASRLTVISVGAITSLPLWYLAGSRLAATTNSWARWVLHYASVCGLWTVLVFALLFVLCRILC